MLFFSNQFFFIAYCITHKVACLEVKLIYCRWTECCCSQLTQERGLYFPLVKHGICDKIGHLWSLFSCLFDPLKQCEGSASPPAHHSVADVKVLILTDDVSGFLNKVLESTEVPCNVLRMYTPMLPERCVSLYVHMCHKHVLMTD